MATRVKTINEALEMAMPSLLSQYLRDPDSTHVFAPFIEGPPGIGKSASIESLAKKLGVTKVIFISCGVIDPNLEFVGLPEIIKKDKAHAYVQEIDLKDNTTKIIEEGDAGKILTKWMKPERLAAFDDLGPDERGLLIFDDVHFLLQQQQAMIMQLLTNAMTIHTHKIGSGNNVAIMFLANRLEDNAGAQELLSPVIDRVKRIIIDYDTVRGAKEWAEWADDAGLHASVVSYVRQNPDTFYTFEADDDLSSEDIQTEKFASPRGWEYLAQEVELLEAIANDPAERREILKKAVPKASTEFEKEITRIAQKILYRGYISKFASGTVGEKAAREFATHYEIYSKYALDRFLEKDSFDIDPSELMVASARFGMEFGKKLVELESEIQRLLIEKALKTKKTKKGLKSLLEPSPELLKKAEEQGWSKSFVLSFINTGKQVLQNAKNYDDLSVEDKRSVLFALLLTKQYREGYPTDVLVDLLEKAMEKPNPTIKDVFGKEFEKRVSGYLNEDIARKLKTYGRFVVNLATTIDKSGQAVQPLFGAFFGSLTSSVKKHKQRYIENGNLVETIDDNSISNIFIDVILTSVKFNVKGLKKFENLVYGVSTLLEEKQKEKKKSASK